MHIWVVYESRLGNTAYVAKAIADALSSAHRVRLTEPENAGMPTQIDLLFIGYPSHRHKSPQAIFAWLAKLPYGALNGTWFAIFDVRFRRFRFCRSNRESKQLIRLLQQIGGKKAGAPQSFYLLGKGGPIPESEIRRSIRWALSLEAKLSRQSPLATLSEDNQKRVMFSHSN